MVVTWWGRAPARPHLGPPWLYNAATPDEQELVPTDTPQRGFEDSLSDEAQALWCQLLRSASQARQRSTNKALAKSEGRERRCYDRGSRNTARMSDTIFETSASFSLPYRSSNLPEGFTR